MNAVETVEAEVRELVRRRGLDPVEDRAAVRRLADEVISDYDDRALTSALAPLADTRTAARAVFDAVAGFGPLQRHLDDPDVEEIWVSDRPGDGSHTNPGRLLPRGTDARDRPDDGDGTRPLGPPRRPPSVG